MSFEDLSFIRKIYAPKAAMVLSTRGIEVVANECPPHGTTTQSAMCLANDEGEAHVTSLEG